MVALFKIDPNQKHSKYLAVGVQFSEFNIDTQACNPHLYHIIDHFDHTGNSLHVLS